MFVRLFETVDRELGPLTGLVNKAATMVYGQGSSIRGCMQRGGQPEEVATAILWLLSDEASFTTDAIIDVAGGR
jgi:hypothetical protein